MRLTPRGRLLLWLVLATAAFLIGVATAPYCWNGDGYSYCSP